MSCILRKYRLFFFILILCIGCSGVVCGQNRFEAELQKKTDSLILTDQEFGGDVLFPNAVLQSLTVPSGWGGFGTYLFGGIGGDYLQPYGTKPDLISFAGFCMGNPQKFVNLAISINNTDVSKIGNFSGNFAVSRQILTASSISFGGMQLFADKHISDSPGATFYIAFSHAVQSIPSRSEGSSGLSYTIGIGTGRLYLKSPADNRHGKGTHGTAVFANVSYEVLKWMNVNAEWSGMNLGLSIGLKPLNAPLAIGVGVTNLTKYTSDKPNLSFAVSYPLSLKR